MQNCVHGGQAVGPKSCLTLHPQGAISAKGLKSETADRVNLSYLPERLHIVQAGLDGAVNARLFLTLNDSLDQQSAQ